MARATPKSSSTKAENAQSLSKQKTDRKPTDSTAPTILKKQDVLDQAVARCNVKKRDAKPAIEAALAVLADALLAGDDVNLPPLGKIRVIKSKQVGDGVNVLTLKLRTMKPGAKAVKTGLAEQEDAD